MANDKVTSVRRVVECLHGWTALSELAFDEAWPKKRLEKNNWVRNTGGRPRRWYWRCDSAFEFGLTHGPGMRLYVTITKRSFTPIILRRKNRIARTNRRVYLRVVCGKRAVLDEIGLNLEFSVFLANIWRTANSPIFTNFITMTGLRSYMKCFETIYSWTLVSIRGAPSKEETPVAVQRKRLMNTQLSRLQSLRQSKLY